MLADWDHRYSGCPPLGHELKVRFPDRWVRFHSLHRSKRWPEADADYKELLHRHNCILDALAEPDASLVLLTTGFSNAPQPTRDIAELTAADPSAAPWRSIALHDLENDAENSNYWHVYASRYLWRPGCFDAIIRLVADDIISNVVIVPEASRWVLHPYDGGMDVIAESSNDRDRIRTTFRDWLSGYSNGL